MPDPNQQSSVTAPPIMPVSPQPPAATTPQKFPEIKCDFLKVYKRDWLLILDDKTIVEKFGNQVADLGLKAGDSVTMRDWESNQHMQGKLIWVDAEGKEVKEEGNKDFAKTPKKLVAHVFLATLCSARHLHQ